MKTLSGSLLKAKEDTKSQKYCRVLRVMKFHQMYRKEIERFKGAAGEDFREVK